MISLAIVAMTVVISLAAFNNRRLLERLILWPPAVRAGQYDRLITYGFVHADGTHLAFNMIALWSFGAAMEPLYAARLGSFGFAFFYAAALIVSILPTFLANRNNREYRSLGASGGVSAVLFAYILIAPWSKILVFFVPVPSILFAVVYVGYSIYMDRRGRDNINHSAHLWGAAFGILFTLVMEPRIGPVFLDRLIHPGAVP